jgi:hypothetical protein
MDSVIIRPFRSGSSDSYHFKKIAEEWIIPFMSEPDIQAMNNPEEVIIIKAQGHIFMAELNNEVVGTCSIYKSKTSENTYKLTKMGVYKTAQGKGIGYLTR